MKVLMVCTGNLCRSPMAEGLLRHALAERGCSEVEVASVGTWAYVGTPATEQAVEVLRTRGVDLSEHRSRPVDPSELRDADLIIAMTSVHVREISSLAPDVAERIVMMKELREIEPAPLPPDSTSRQKAASLLAGRRPPRRRSLDVDDPMGLPMGAYERCVKELEEGVKVLVDTLCN